MPTSLYEQARDVVERMSRSELDQFVPEVLALSARRRAPMLSHVESNLLQTINRGVPEAVRVRSRELNNKRRAGTISETELAELIRINDFVEQMATDRVEAMAELAQVRQTTLPELMRTLGLLPKAYD